jgi:hypothetical protein
MTYQRNETPEPLASATPITEAFEAKYQRSAEDPTSAEMLAIFSEGWNAATERAAKLCDGQASLCAASPVAESACEECAAAIRASDGMGAES